MSRALDKTALHALRMMRRKKFPEPLWGDHVLRGIKGFTTAGKLVVNNYGSKVMETLRR